MSSSASPDHELLEQLAPITKNVGYSNSFRGIAVFTELLRLDNCVNQVYHSRRHIVVTFKDAKSLVVFDNVPHWAHPEQLDIPTLISTLLSDSPSVPHIFSLRYSSPILTVVLDTRTCAAAVRKVCFLVSPSFF